jgi:hypothetical protein
MEKRDVIIILMEKIMQKTKEGEAIWEKTSRDGRFKFALDSGIIMIHPETNIDGGSVYNFYVVTFLDRNGDELETHHNPIENRFMSELYAAITRQAGELAKGIYEAMIRELDEPVEAEKAENEKNANKKRPAPSGITAKTKKLLKPKQT